MVKDYETSQGLLSVYTCNFEKKGKTYDIDTHNGLTRIRRRGLKNLRDIATEANYGQWIVFQGAHVE